MLFHVQMQITISSLEHARTVFPSEWGAEGNRGSGRTFGRGCRDELCYTETFPEFKMWSMLHRRCREQGKGIVPRVSPQLFLCVSPLPTLEDWHSWPLNRFFCLQECLLQSIPNACCQSDSFILSFIHSDISYWTLNVHKGYTSTTWGERDPVLRRLICNDPSHI